MSGGVLNTDDLAAFDDLRRRHEDPALADLVELARSPLPPLGTPRAEPDPVVEEAVASLVASAKAVALRRRGRGRFVALTESRIVLDTHSGATVEGGWERLMAAFRGRQRSGALVSSAASSRPTVTPEPRRRRGGLTVLPGRRVVLDSLGEVIPGGYAKFVQHESRSRAVTPAVPSVDAALAAFSDAMTAAVDGLRAALAVQPATPPPAPAKAGSKRAVVMPTHQAIPHRVDVNAALRADQARAARPLDGIEIVEWIDGERRTRALTEQDIRAWVEREKRYGQTTTEGTS